MNSLVLSKVKNLNFSNENVFVLEQFFKDFYKKKNISNNIKVLPPFNNKKTQRIKAFENCNKIYNDILKEISQSLNKLHKINFSDRAWEIILGDWLMYFVWILFERYNSIEEFLLKYEIKKFYGIKNKNFSFTSNSTMDIIQSSIDEEWNSNLYFKILNFLNCDKKNISFEDYVLLEKPKLEITKKKNKFLKKIHERILKIFSFLQFKNEAVIINTYLPLLYENFFELLLCQVPKLRKFNNISYKTYNSELRSKINLSVGEEKNFINFIKSNIKEFLPVCVVESFSDILSQSKSSGLPNNPKFVFTSNDYEGNEIFKFYVANLLMEKKLNYIIGQHGNLYFTDLRIDKHRTEFNTCDKFLTWGFEKSPKFKKSFNFSSFGRKKYKQQSKEGFLIVVSPIDFKIYPYNSIDQTETGYENILSIIKSVNSEISKNTIIRLNHLYKTNKKGNYYFNKYFKNQPVKIDMGVQSFVKARCNAKLTFFNYDSSGILENLALNYPTICMWNNIEKNLNDNFIRDYKLLIDAKILFSNKNDLVEHLNKIWKNVDEWWLSQKTQDKVRKFNKKLNITGNLSSLLELKKLCLKKK